MCSKSETCVFHDHIQRQYTANMCSLKEQLMTHSGSIHSQHVDMPDVYRKDSQHVKCMIHNCNSRTAQEEASYSQTVTAMSKKNSSKVTNTKNTPIIFKIMMKIQLFWKTDEKKHQKKAGFVTRISVTISSITSFFLWRASKL